MQRWQNEKNVLNTRERATGEKKIIIIINNSNNWLINKYHNIDTWYTLKWSIVRDYMQMLVRFGLA